MINTARKYTYDLIVIGGGSGGMSSARKTASLGKKVALLDYVYPSPQGTTWGMGGTCVNVGCVPKKIMHYSSIFGEMRKEQYQAGWEINTDGGFNWTRMRENVNQHVRNINNYYSKAVVKEEVDYKNLMGEIVDAHTVKAFDPLDESKEPLNLTAENILIATGGRPRYLDIPGLKENCITSDDIFWREQEPGKTLVIGAGYIGLECGGFLTGMGYDVTVLARSIPLRGFDQDMVEKILIKFDHDGTKIHSYSSPTNFKKLESGKIEATWVNSKTKEETTEEFDTILLAAGRVPNTKNIGLENVGIETVRGFIDVDNANKTSVDNIYAVGDILLGKPQLTPVAIKQGRYLAHRLFNNIDKRVNYDHVATTIFTPLEYALIGLNEEQAIDRLGKDGIDVYLTSFNPSEWAFSKFTDHPKPRGLCFGKMIVDKKQNDKVIGLHYVGTNAGEVMQGFAVAVTGGLNKEVFDATIPIHPTSAEELVLFTRKKDLNATSSSN